MGMTKVRRHTYLKKLSGNKKILTATIVLFPALVIGSVTLAYNVARSSAEQTAYDNPPAAPQKIADFPQTTPEEAPTQGIATTEDKTSTSSSPPPRSSVTHTTITDNQKISTQPPSRPVYTESPPVPPNPYCPAPRFDLSITRAPNSYNLYINVIPAYINPSNTPECGGVGYDTPIVTYPTNGNLCSGIIYPTSYMSWGMACTIYSSAKYGAYTYTFTVKAFNGFNVSTTHTATYTINYQQE